MKLADGWCNVSKYSPGKNSSSEETVQVSEPHPQEERSLAYTGRIRSRMHVDLSDPGPIFMRRISNCIVPLPWEGFTLERNKKLET